MALGDIRASFESLNVRLLLDSLLSRTDDAPLEHHTGENRAVLEQQGWASA